MFTLQTTMHESAQLPGLVVTPLAVDPGTARFDLTLVAEQTGEDLELMLEYNTDMFADLSDLRFQIVTAD